MYVSEQGLLVAEDGDGFNIITMLRGGTTPLKSGTPLIGINHCYGMFVPEGKDNDPRSDGTLHCAEAFSSGKAKYGPQVYMARGSTAPGVPGADLYQMAPLHHRTFHCEGMCKVEMFKHWLNNDIAIGIEWAMSGWFRTDGTDWTGPKGRNIWNKRVYNLDRPDFEKVGRFYWQRPSAAQVYTAQRFWDACRMRYETLSPEHCIHGHEQMGSGGHMCPGPLEMTALTNEVLPYLTGQQSESVDPVSWDEVFNPPSPLTSKMPEDVFAMFGGSVTEDQLLTYFTPAEVDCMLKSGAITTEDPENFVSLPEYKLVPGVPLTCDFSDE